MQIRTPPSVDIRTRKTMASVLANTCINRGRPRRAAPTVRSEIIYLLCGEAFVGGFAEGLLLQLRDFQHQW